MALEWTPSQSWNTEVVTFWCCVPDPEAAAARLCATTVESGVPFIFMFQLEDAFFTGQPEATIERWEQFKFAWQIIEIELEIDEVTITVVPVDMEWSINLGAAFTAGDAPIFCSSPCRQLDFINRP